MKYLKQLTALAASIFIFGASFASAKTLDAETQTYTLPSFVVNGFSDPVLQTYDTPRISSYKIGEKITMYYTINKQGHVEAVRSDVSPFRIGDSRELSIVMADAIKNWKFAPAMNSDGEPVAIRVSMPVKVTAPDSGSEAFAGIVQSEMKLVVKES